MLLKNHTIIWFPFVERYSAILLNSRNYYKPPPTISHTYSWPSSQVAHRLVRALLTLTFPSCRLDRP